MLNDAVVRPDSVPLFEAKGGGRHRYSGIIRIGDEFIEDTKAFYEGHFSALADISASFSYLPTGSDEPIEFALTDVLFWTVSGSGGLAVFGGTQIRCMRGNGNAQRWTYNKSIDFRR
ncbi:hypothetical protein AD949_01215 [Acetobacter orleanensis]|nr:hypothetical protein AD949_01215 [Acetobacter orleanensis]